jgi:hypothetical protein
LCIAERARKISAAQRQPDNTRLTNKAQEMGRRAGAYFKFIQKILLKNAAQDGII